MNKLLILFVIAVAIGSIACEGEQEPSVIKYGDYYGKATYDVTEADYLYDDFGFAQTSICTGRVTFNGWFDDDCDAMVVSETRYSKLYCKYTDHYGGLRVYYELFLFLRGYISESCDASKIVQNQYDPTGGSESDLNATPKIDPATQPDITDGQMHAIIVGRTGKHHVNENLGKNISTDEALETFGPLKRERALNIPIERLVYPEKLTNVPAEPSQ